MKTLLFGQLKEGTRVRYSHHIPATEGIVHKEGDNQWYFLSDDSNYHGSLCSDLKGYKYSFWFGNNKGPDESVDNMELIDGPLSSTPNDVKGDAVPRNKQIDTLLILGL